MGCGGSFNGSQCPASINSFFDLLNTLPKCPLDLIASASLNGTTGVVSSSTNFGSESTWADVGCATPIMIIGSKPTVTALGSDSAQNVADAAQWNFSHLTWNSALTVAFPLRKTLFLRAGTNWSNRINLTTGATIVDPQLSFLNNAATRGDGQGTIPVIAWTGNFTAGALALDVVVKEPGCVRMGLKFNSGGSSYMFDMDWWLVP